MSLKYNTPYKRIYALTEFQGELASNKVNVNKTVVCRNTASKLRFGTFLIVIAYAFQ